MSRHLYSERLTVAHRALSATPNTKLSWSLVMTSPWKRMIFGLKKRSVESNGVNLPLSPTKSSTLTLLASLASSVSLTGSSQEAKTVLSCTETAPNPSLALSTNAKHTQLQPAVWLLLAALGPLRLYSLQVVTVRLPFGILMGRETRCHRNQLRPPPNVQLPSINTNR